MTTLKISELQRLSDDELKKLSLQRHKGGCKKSTTTAIRAQYVLWKRAGEPFMSEDHFLRNQTQSLGDGKYLYWRPTGMGEDEDMQFRIGDYLVRRWDDRIDDYNWFCYSKDEWLSEKKYYMKIAKK